MELSVPELVRTIVENTDIAGDNQVNADSPTNAQAPKITAITPLTWDLGVSTVPAFNVTSRTPEITIAGTISNGVGVTGTSLNGDDPCRILVYGIFQRPTSDTTLDTTIIELQNRQITANAITGDLPVPPGAPAGDYKVKVFLGDKVGSPPHTAPTTPIKPYGDFIRIVQ